MKKYLYILLLTVASCANHSGQSPLLTQFMAFQASTNTATEQDFVSPTLWQSLNTARNNSHASAFANALSLFPNEITTISDSKETIEDSTGCLLVSGTNAEQIPMDYYISYRMTNHQWIIEDITSKYFLDGEKRFLQTAVCDKEKRMELWLAFMNESA